MNIRELVRDELIDGGLGLSSATCYITAVSAFVAESSPFYVQVMDNGGAREGDPGGNTEGERVSVKISVFVHMSLDQESRAEQALIKAAVGLDARIAAIKGVLNGSWLESGNPPVSPLAVPLYWMERMPPIAHPADPNWVQQDLVFVGYRYSRIA